MRRITLALGLLTPIVAQAQLISSLPSASTVSPSDLIPLTQGSTGAGTGTTRKATVSQLVSALVNPAQVAITGGTIAGLTSLGVGGTVTLNQSLSSVLATNYNGVNSNNNFQWPNNSGGCCRVNYWSDVATVVGNQSNTSVLETNFFNLILSGTGTLTNEAFNMVHPYVDIQAGVTISGYAENFEASAGIEGNVSGSLNSYLSIATINSGGNVANFIGYHALFYNNGTLGNYTGYECDGISGTQPTISDFCLQNRDANAAITTAGGLTVGSFSSVPPAGQVQIIAAGHTGSTYPLFIRNNLATPIAYINDLGGASFSYDTSVSGAMNATYYKVSGTLGANCSGALSGSAVVQYGIITHC